MSDVYTLTYPSSISLKLDDGTLKIMQGSSTDTETSDLSDVSTDVQGDDGIWYKLRGLNLWSKDNDGSDVPPIFPISAVCSAAVPANLQTSSSPVAYIMIVMIVLAAAFFFFLLAYNGNQSFLAGARSWLLGK